jgi:hypothetical protein
VLVRSHGFDSWPKLNAYVNSVTRKADPDLAGLREPAALVRLPADEPRACRAA